MNSKTVFAIAIACLLYAVDLSAQVTLLSRRPTPVSSPSFSPADVPSYYIDLDPDVNITPIGVGLSNWIDKASGILFTNYARSSASTPSIVSNNLNGHNVIRADGGDSMLASNAIPIAQPFCVYIVFIQTNLATFRYVGVDGASTRNILGFVNITNKYAIRSGGTTVETIPATFGDHVLLSAVFNGGSSKYRLNGNSWSNASVGGDALDSGFGVCGRVGGNGLQGDFVRLLIYSNSVSEANDVLIQNYLNSEYQLW